MPTPTPKINICKACQQEVFGLKFAYCSVCSEDMAKADLQLAIKNHIPKDWSMGQFVFNFLEWLGQKKDISTLPVLRLVTCDCVVGEDVKKCNCDCHKYKGMADPFHLSDDDLIKYWFEYIKEIK